MGEDDNKGFVGMEDTEPGNASKAFSDDKPVKDPEPSQDDSNGDDGDDD